MLRGVGSDYAHRAYRLAGRVASRALARAGRCRWPSGAHVLVACDRPSRLRAQPRARGRHCLPECVAASRRKVWLQLTNVRSNEFVRLPGVAEATVSNVPPFNGFGVGVEISGASEWLAGAFVSPGWFRTFGTPLVAGRDFTEHDRAGPPRVAVVNQAFARAFLHGVNPLGRTMTISTETPGPPVEIVGVVADIASSSLREEPPPVVYIPLAQVDRNFRRGHPADFARGARAQPERARSERFAALLKDDVAKPLAQSVPSGC